MNPKIVKLEAEIKERKAEIHKLKGPQVRLCGGCYHKESANHNCYMVQRNGHCPISVYLSEWSPDKTGFYSRD